MSPANGNLRSQYLVLQEPVSTLHPALVAYLQTNERRQSIAQRHGISARTLTAWVRQAGLPQRQAGRARLDEPSPAQRRILRQIGSAPLRELARKVGCSKQYLHQLAKRWPDWVNHRGLPLRRRTNGTPVATRRS